MSTSDELTNSRRSVLKATFTPVRIGEAAGDGGHLLAVAGALRSLNVIGAESEELRRTGGTDQELAVVSIVERLTAAPSATRSLEVTQALQDLPSEQLVQFVERVKGLRQRMLAEGIRALNTPVPVDVDHSGESQTAARVGEM